LPNVDFSRVVLEQAQEGVHVLPVPPCGWTDLGTPRRVSECAAENSCPHRNSGDATIGQAERHGAPRPPAVSNYRRCDVDLAEVALRANEGGHSTYYHSSAAIPSGLE